MMRHWLGRSPFGVCVAILVSGALAASTVVSASSTRRDSRNATFTLNVDERNPAIVESFNTSFPNAVTVHAGGEVGDAATRAAESAPIPGIVDVNAGLAYEDSMGAGTGIVLSASGEVITNNHVIEGETALRVTDLDNGHTYAASVVGYDLSADLAVLQLHGAPRLAIAPLGNSTSARVGQAVRAIGNAEGKGGPPAVTSGTVTALDRSITAADELMGTSERLKGLIETTAKLEPGDSGGPLVDAANRVVGIDTASGGNQGFSPQSLAAITGSAIPIDTALTVARAIEAGHASSAVHLGATPFLGVDTEEVNPFAHARTGPKLLVVDVFPATPAARSGLAAGDVITTLDGKAISSDGAFTAALLAEHPGSTVRLGWLAGNGSTHSATVRLASGPPQ